MDAKQSHWNSLPAAERTRRINAERAKIEAFGGDMRKAERAAMLVAYDNHRVDAARQNETNATRDAYERGFAFVNGREYPLENCPSWIINGIRSQLGIT